MHARAVDDGTDEDQYLGKEQHIHSCPKLRILNAIFI